MLPSGDNRLFCALFNTFVYTIPDGDRQTNHVTRMNANFEIRRVVRDTQNVALITTYLSHSSCRRRRRYRQPTVKSIMIILYIYINGKKK